MTTIEAEDGPKTTRRRRSRAAVDEAIDLLGIDGDTTSEAGPKAKASDGPSSIAALRPALAELIATMLFVFIGAGTVVVTSGLLGEELTSARLVAIALAHGLAIMLLVSATANISGGHINPAVTLAAMVSKRISIDAGILYILAQLIGAVVGAMLVAAAIPVVAHRNLGAHGLGMDVTVVDGLITEIILTFILVFVIFATAMDPKGLIWIAPLAIGVAVLVDHLVGVSITGASMNPARSFGPALVGGTWSFHWIYWVGPAIGGVAAAFVYENIFMNRDDAAAKNEDDLD